MSESDPFELLRRLNPVARERFDADDEARLAAILDEKVDEKVVVLHDRRRTRHAIVGTIAVGAVAATAAWVVLREEPVTDPLQVACYRSADLDSDRHVVDDPGDPVDACVDVWGDGVFGTASVPELTSCTAESGTAAVFPGGPDVCERLGLPTVGAATVDFEGVRRLDERLRLEFGPRCVPYDDAVQFVDDVLEELHLSGWTIVQSAPFSADRPCTFSGVDPELRTVSIGGRPARDLVPSASATP